jgi:putative peptidoglycan lipid II flippase
MSRSIIKKALGIGSSTLLSRFFAYFREILTMQFLGVGVISDAFFLALRVPTSLRKVFAEGALSSVLVPALIRADQKEGVSGVDRLLSLSFVMIELLIGLIVIGICWYADVIVYQMAPGASQEQLLASVRFLKILAPFILFLSSSAVLSAALQATNRFLLPGLAPAVLNFLYVICLGLGLYFSWSVENLCWSWIAASALNFLVHVVVCWMYNFKILLPHQSTWKGFFYVMLQLLPCILSVGIGEINFWIDSAFASYLPSGTISLLRCAYQLVNIPLGVIATSLSIVLLPQFSKIGHSKQELGVYLAEAIKLVTWMMLPITIVMIFSSREIFETMFFSSKFTMGHVVHAQWNMNAYAAGLLFFALEKILLNAFYALQSTGIATAVACVTIAMNFFMNRMLMSLYGGMGLALATSISAGLRIVMFILILAYYFNINFHAVQIWRLFKNYLIQLCILGIIFMSVAMGISSLIATSSLYYVCDIWLFSIMLDTRFFLHSFGYWLWFGPLTAIFFFIIYKTRKFFWSIFFLS